MMILSFQTFATHTLAENKRPDCRCCGRLKLGYVLNAYFEPHNPGSEVVTYEFLAVLQIVQAL